ncbi:MAG: ABC transporter substrate-binding protein, partial [Deinococcota bacterium]
EGDEVDWIFTISPQNLEALQADENIIVETSPRLSYDYFGLNTTRAPFDDVRVRQAIAYSIDRDQICAGAFFCSAVNVNKSTTSYRVLLHLERS